MVRCVSNATHASDYKVHSPGHWPIVRSTGVLLDNERRIVTERHQQICKAQSR